MIIAIANSKGGVGKSTVAVHLATWLHAQGHRVLLADCDTQQSSSVWIKEACSEIPCVRLADADAILNELPALKADVDYIICDGPGSQTDTTRTMLLLADLAIVPCKASMLEARALAKATEVLRQAQLVRKGAPDAVIVLSMVGKTYRLTQDMRDAAEALGIPMASTPLVLRQSFADAPGQGTVVSKMGSRAHEAAKEVNKLFRELLPEAVKGAQKPSKRKVA